MAEPTRPGAGSTSGADQRGSELRRRLQAARARMEGGFATALSSALNAAGLRIAVQSVPAPVDLPPVGPRVSPVTASTPAAAEEARPFPPAAFSSSPHPLRTGLSVAADGPGSSRPAAPSAASFVFPKVPAPSKQSLRPAALPKSKVVGPTPVQVMSAVQNAVVGAVKVVSGTIAGVSAARDAAVAATKTAGGAASVASGMATVASGFFPQLAALGIGVPKAPKNRPGLPPQRRVADIIANPLGQKRPSGAPGADGTVPHPTRRVQRVPMVRAKSSLDISRKEKTRKRRSYDDLQMKPQIGLTPHEVLLKVATLALGKTLLGMLEAGARGQQKALQKASERMSQKQIMLLGMLPAQYIVQRLPQQPQLPAAPSAHSAPEQAERPGATKPTGPFKIRY